MRGLYAIADLETLAAFRCDPVAFAEAVLPVRPAALQLRAKDTPARETLAVLRAIAPLCHRVGVPLVANDRPDLALFAGCDLVHVGQGDIPIDRARRIAPGIGVGVSTHDAGQLEAALAFRPAYVAFGPVFETQSKRNAEPVVGLAALRHAHVRALAVGIPLVAIGGISRDRARSLVGAADAIAVIGELLPRAAIDAGAPMTEILEDVTRRARALHELFAARESFVEAAR
jgi:thiamine-phosphate pyrophosphorylase